MSIDVLVVANDVIPGMSLPTAAPGLRAAGIAWGLRDHGLDVRVALNADPLDRAYDGATPPPTVPGTVHLRPQQLASYIRAHRPKAVVITNSNHFDHLHLPQDTTLVFDFFAPKVLELETESRPDLDKAVAQLTDRKLRALARADIVLTNGRKKEGYVHSWLARSRPDAAEVPVVDVPTPLPALEPLPPADGPLQAIVAGYFQPWSRPAQWTFALEPMLREGRLQLHILLADHWGQTALEEGVSHGFEELLELPNVIRHQPAEYGDFQMLLRRCDISIDVFERNPERELAMVTRTLVALACGVPAIHVPFTETGALIAEHGGGWVVDETSPTSVLEVLEEAAATDRGARQRAEAHAFARAHLEPANAVRPLLDLLRST